MLDPLTDKPPRCLRRNLVHAFVPGPLSPKLSSYCTNDARRPRASLTPDGARVFQGSSESASHSSPLTGQKRPHPLVDQGLSAQVGEYREHSAVIVVRFFEIELAKDRAHVTFDRSWAQEDLLADPGV